MNINQYPVNFGYLEQTTINGSPYTHRGNDYPLRYEPVKIAGTQIGVSGETGLTVGPHVHVQAGRDEWAQSTINPTPYVGKPGTVVKTGSGSQWGLYVCLRVGDVNVFYCHLSKINATVGQVIKEEEVKIPNQDNYYQRYKKAMYYIRGRDLKGGFTREEFNKNFVGRDNFAMLEAMLDSVEADTAHEWMKVGHLALKDKWAQQIYGLQAMVKKLESGQQVTQAEIDEMANALEDLRKKLINSNK